MASLGLSIFRMENCECCRVNLFFDLEIVFLDDDFDVADVFEDDFGTPIAGVIYFAVAVGKALAFAEGSDGHATGVNSFFEEVVAGVLGATFAEFDVMCVAGTGISVAMEFND